MIISEKALHDFRTRSLEKQGRIYRKILDRVPGLKCFDCPLCGFYGPFQTFGIHKRPHARCPSCGSLERIRLLIRYLEKFRPVKATDKVLELAPFMGTANYFQYAKRCEFIGVDIDAEKMIARDIPCVQADLCLQLPSNLGGFDIIINSHVMEHLKCDPYDVIERVTSLLRLGGIHLISVPYGNDKTIEDLSESMHAEERTRRFGHPQHYRAFGHQDFPLELEKRFGSRFCEIDRAQMTEQENSRYSLGLHLPANRLFCVRADAS